MTSGDRARVRRELSGLEVERYFRTVVFGGDTRAAQAAPRGPAPGPGPHGRGPGRAAYVGDSPEDVEMARAAGVRAVGVPGGFPNREALAASRPDLLAPDVLAAVNALVA